MQADDTTPDDAPSDDTITTAGPDDTIGSRDIARLNALAVERASAMTRLAGTALIVVGAIGVAAWLWLTARRWLALDDIGAFTGSDFVEEESDVSLADRLDVVFDFIFLLIYGALAAGGGFVLRLVADYTVARTGGSLSHRFAAGEPVPGREPVQVEVEPFA